MTEAVIVAGISLVGTLFGTFGGIMASNRLTVYRIEQLEKKVEKHNNLVDRVYHLESADELIHERLDEIDKRLEKEE